MQKILKRLSISRTKREYIPDTMILKGMQCKKLYWLEQHEPHNKSTDPGTEALKTMIKTEVEEKAKSLFPGAFEVKAKRIETALKETQKAMAGGHEVILGALFEHEGVTTRIDALKKEGHGYSLYEIKSSAGVKDVYFNEAALKWSLLNALQVPLYRSCIIHINSRYVRHGELDLNALFTIRNITQVVRRRQENMVKATDEVRSFDAERPNIHIGSWCNDPYPCDFMPLCWKDVPKPSVFDLHMLPGKRKFELYRQGIVRFEEIPKDISLRVEQQRQVEAELYDREFIDREALTRFLETIRYPVYFLDFETYQQAVPRFENLRPYEQIPFQFSLHIVAHEGAEPEHIEYLGDAEGDPRAGLADKLAASIGETGTIVAYNQSFEKSVIKRLADNYPQNRETLTGMLGRFVDLMYPFERGLYYTKAMNGRHSIKTVLPALVPELSYTMLNIQHGGEAMNAFATLHLRKNQQEIARTRENLLEYCKLDTLAMVRIWEKLISVTNNKD